MCVSLYASICSLCFDAAMHARAAETGKTAQNASNFLKKAAKSGMILAADFLICEKIINFVRNKFYTVCHLLQIE